MAKLSKTTERIRAEQAGRAGPESPEDVIEHLLMELHLIGFGVAKEIARLRGLTSGTMPCPLCQKELRFSISPSNGHMAAKCETPKCINAME